MKHLTPEGRKQWSSGIVGEGLPRMGGIASHGEGNGDGRWHENEEKKGVGQPQGGDLRARVHIVESLWAQEVHGRVTQSGGLPGEQLRRDG